MNKQPESIVLKAFTRLRKDGLFPTLRWAVGAALYHPVIRWMDSSFDRRHGVETTRLIHHSDFKVDQDAIGHARSYGPIPERLLKKYIVYNNLDCSEYSFVDLGCGKGRALMLATRWPFKKIIGVELEPSIHQVCLSNVRKFIEQAPSPVAEISVQHGNAAEFTFPEGNILLFLYNPFSESIMEMVCHRLAEAINAAPREIRIVYFHPHAVAPLEKLPNLKRIAYETVRHRGSIDGIWPVAIYSLDP